MIEILTQQNPGKWQSYVFHSKLHNYIITIYKLDAVWLSHLRGWMLSSGGKVTKVSVRGVDRHCDFFQDSNYNKTTVEGEKHLVSSSFLPVTDAVFWAEMWQRVGWTDMMTDTSPHITAVFFSSYKMPKTLPVTMWLLFGPVTLLFGTFVFILLSEGSV